MTTVSIRIFKDKDNSGYSKNEIIFRGKGERSRQSGDIKKKKKRSSTRGPTKAMKGFQPCTYTHNKTQYGCPLTTATTTP